MKFIIDAHLPSSLAHYFEEHDIIHTSKLQQGNYTSDNEINQLSMLESRILF